MQIRFIGDGRDVTGFRLAGIDGVRCRTHDDVATALETWARDGTAAIVLVGHEAAALAPDELERLRQASDVPIVVVLPPIPRDASEEGRTG